jgi:uncharacterized protein (DUF1697 family)
MHQTTKKEQYVAFLRGINVGGHHKLPMPELRAAMEHLNFEKIVTLLNSGNVVFEGAPEDTGKLEERISKHLEKTFGFTVPVIVRNSKEIKRLLNADPFKNRTISKDIRLYVSFLKNYPAAIITLPWTSDDGAFTIIDIADKTIISILDLSVSGTPKGMESLEKIFGTDITTRNWNTIKRLEKQLHSGL